MLPLSLSAYPMHSDICKKEKKKDYEIIFLGIVFEKYFFPFFSFGTLVLGNFSETRLPDVAVDLIDVGCL